ncbi:protein OPI10 homolog [Physcomitrium patens]|uniref:Uncharacterized protein n=1 Tax=Physcomitrium patens TaxID=3218 RepID=A0A2K1JYQ3_PHYPA|nr:uncharacterized protein LOC112287884 [Physcomitrium patens]PNR46657.1 hypothetical protein PHYPA_013777 [Physcomitrium patens]|eukprot:XP_024387247.1 uncharacterized protein LOC112287884 [Physcomitrella patens]
MATRQPAQIFVKRSSEAGPSLTHGRRQFAPSESSVVGDEVDESVVRRKKRAIPRTSESDADRAGPSEIVPSFVGQAIIPTNIFGVLFPNRSYPLDASNFTQVDTHKWLLNMDIFVGEPYDKVTEICIYLFHEESIPPDKAVAVYVQSPGSSFQFRGGVTRACPSSVLSLLWPTTSSQMNLIGSTSRPVTAKIGVSIEDAATLPALNVGRHRQLEQVALNVGRNLFNFMQSFCHVQDNHLGVPRGIFEQWYKKFVERSQRDPEYVNRLLVA